MKQSPNILYLHSHDAGRYVQPYGHAIATPNVQKLAEEGTLFRKAFCANPTCSPSRAALLTGQTPHQCGMFGLAGKRGWSFSHPERDLVSYLRKTAGYHTAKSGVHHTQPEHFDETLKTWGAGGGVDFLLSAPKQPFFLSVGLGDPHRMGRSFSVAPNYAAKTDPRYVKVPDPLPDTPETRQDMADYIDATKNMDHQMGQVLEALQRSGLAENTVVICTTDHGIAFPDMKCSLTDHGMGVMLIIRGPGGFSAGQVVDAMVSHVDLFPTICDLAGIEHPDWLEGRSLLPLVRDETKQLHEEIFAEVSFHASYEPQRAIRTERWKYIRHFAADRRMRLANCDASPSKDLWMENGWTQDQVARTEHRLYDLLFDPQERHNLAGEADYDEVLKDLQQRLHAWMERTGDPLLHGEIPTPEGATILVNEPDSIEPSEPTRAWEGVSNWK